MPNVITKWSQFYITDAGLRLRQRAIASEGLIDFCYAKIGQGVPLNPANIPLMTDIVLPAEQVPVVRSEADGTTHYAGVRIDNANFDNPVLMTEIGLFARIDDEEPILYGYTYAEQGYDSIPAGKVSHYVWLVGIDTVISRATSVTFTYDGSKVYATELEMDALIQSFDEFRGQIESGLMPSDMPEKVDEAVEKAANAEKTANDVKAIVEDFSASSITSQGIIIPTVGWAAAPADEYSGVCVDIPIEGLTEDMIPIISILPSQAWQNCGFNSAPRVLEGKLRIYAQSVPTQPVTASAAFLSPSANTASGNYKLLAATADRLGGVKIGDGVDIQEDGTISVNNQTIVDAVNDVTASDEDGAAVVNRYFGK